MAVFSDHELPWFMTEPDNPLSISVVCSLWEHLSMTEDAATAHALTELIRAWYIPIYDHMRYALIEHPYPNSLVMSVLKLR
jgi:hypothetical protein